MQDIDNQRKGKGELLKRVISGIGIAIPAIFVTLSGGYLFTIFVMILVWLASYELYTLLELKGQSPKMKTGIVSSCSIVLASYFFAPEFLFGLLTFSLITIFLSQLASRVVRGATDTIMMTFFGTIYVGWLASHIVFIRELGKELEKVHGEKIKSIISSSHGDLGAFCVFLVVATTVFADIGAYFGGKRWGNIKIASKISPGKTLEGFLSGTASAIVVSLCVKWLFSAKGDISHYIIYGIVMSIVGLLGDLAESLIKRDVEVKDSGFIMPGHGGILDRIDSLLFTVPVSYYIFKYYLEKVLIPIV